jgi:hypothetical protein
VHAKLGSIIGGLAVVAFIAAASPKTRARWQSAPAGAPNPAPLTLSSNPAKMARVEYRKALTLDPSLSDAEIRLSVLK